MGERDVVYRADLRFDPAPDAVRIERCRVGVRAALDRLRRDGFLARIDEDAIGSKFGLSRIVCPTSAGRASVVSVRVSDRRGRDSIRLVGSREPNADGAAPSEALIAADREAWDALRVEGADRKRAADARYQRALAGRPALVASHEREIVAAREAWEAGARARLGRQVGRGLAKFVGLAAAGLALIFLAVWIYRSWDISAYYDKVFHTWMVLLVIKLAATVVPVFVVGVPLGLGLLLCFVAFTSWSRSSRDEFRPPPPPPVSEPPPPLEEISPPPNSSHSADDRLEARFFQIVKFEIEGCLIAPSR